MATKISITVCLVLFLLCTGSFVFIRSASAQSGSDKGRWKIHPVPPKIMRPIICGNGIVEVTSGELCDDGNRTSGDGCSFTCRWEPQCGDGLVNQPSEQCDDGNTVAGDGCNATCQKEPRCGNGVVEGAEECDDRNTLNQDGCNRRCLFECPPDDFVPPDCSTSWEEILPATTVNDIALDGSDNIHIVGYDELARDIVVYKFDRCGNYRWSLTFGGWPDYPSGGVDVGTGIATDAMGNIYVTGVVQESSSVSRNHIVTKKLDRCGMDIWTSFYPGPFADRSTDIALDGLGSVYVVGSTQTASATGSELLILKYSTETGLAVGAPGWPKIIESTSVGFYGKGIAIDRSNNPVVVAEDTDVSDVKLLKFTPMGEPKSGFGTDGVLLFGIEGQTKGYAIATDVAANILVTGQQRYLEADVGTAYIAKFAPSGVAAGDPFPVLLPAVSEGLALDVDSAGSAYVTGRQTHGGGWENFVRKYSSSGERVWGSLFNHPPWNGLGKGIAVGTDRSTYVTGEITRLPTASTPWWTDVWIRRYTPDGLFE